jgi:tRNA(His) 5'-end guanylyltransferase
MNTAAKSIMRELSSDITLAYGDSDEYRYSSHFYTKGVLTK